MRPEPWSKAGIPKMKHIIIAQFGSVIPNVVRELTRSNDAYNIKMSSCLIAFASSFQHNTFYPPIALSARLGRIVCYRPAFAKAA